MTHVVGKPAPSSQRINTLKFKAQLLKLLHYARQTQPTNFNFGHSGTLASVPECQKLSVQCNKGLTYQF